MLWKCKNTSDIVAFGTLLFLGEVADHMTACVVALAHHVVKKGVDVIVQGLVVEKALAQ